MIIYLIIGKNYDKSIYYIFYDHFHKYFISINTFSLLSVMINLIYYVHN